MYCVQVRGNGASRASERGGQKGTLTPGPMEFRGPMGLRGPIREPNGHLGPIKMTLTNQFVEDRRLFLGRSHENPEKIGPFCIEDFFFQRSHENLAVFLFCFGPHETKVVYYLS